MASRAVRSCCLHLLEVGLRLLRPPRRPVQILDPAAHGRSQLIVQTRPHQHRIGFDQSRLRFGKPPLHGPRPAEKRTRLRVVRDS